MCRLGFFEIVPRGSQRCEKLQNCRRAVGLAIGKKAHPSELIKFETSTESRGTAIATIVRRHRKTKPDNWQVTIRIGKASCTKTFDDLEDAKKFGSSLDKDLSREKEKRQKAARKNHSQESTVFDFNDEKLKETLTLFRDSPGCSSKHRSNVRAILRHIVKIKLGEIKIGEVTPKWVKQYVALLLGTKNRAHKNYCYATIATHLTTMTMACRWRAEDLDLHDQPALFKKRGFPKNWDKKRTRRLNPGEQEKLEQVLREIPSASSQHWLCLVHLALETGARLQEVLGVKHSEVDLESAVWVLPAERTKSKEEREIPLSRRAVAIFKLLSQDAQSCSTRFLHRLGSPPSVSCGFRRYAQRAGLEDFRFHDLRHDSISRMILYKRKLDPYEIMKFVGHSSSEMLMRYTNLRGKELAARME